MKPVKELKSSFRPGDQIWLFRSSKLYVSSYAHVVIFIGDNEYMHVAARNMLTLKSKVKRANFSEEDEECLCFIVRSDIDTEILVRRANLTEHISFHYHPKEANCESYANGVHGIWSPSIQVELLNILR